MSADHTHKENEQETARIKQVDQMNTNSNTSEIITQSQLQRRIKLFEEFIHRLVPFGFSGTVHVAMKNQILIEDGFGYADYESNLPMKPNSIMSLGSIAKQFTALLIMQFVDQQKLATSDTLDKYFENIPHEKSKITIHQLLTHTAGLEQGSGGDFDYISETEFIELFYESELQSEPGTTYAYSNLGFSIAAIIVQKVGKKPYVEQLRELWKNLNIESASWFGDPKYNSENSVSYYVDGKRRGSVSEWPGSWNADKPYWHILGNGGVTISPQDMYTYLQALFKGKLLSQKSLKQLLTTALNDYAYGWDVKDSPIGQMIRHDGGSGGGVASTARYYPDHDLTILLSSNGIINGYGFAFLVEDVMEKIIYGEEVDLLPHIDNSQGDVILADGYRDIDGGRVRVENLDNGPLLLHFEGQDLLNSLLNIETETASSYNRINELTLKFGELVLEKKWEEAFQLAERKTDYERRAGMIEEFLTEIEKNYAPITGVRVAGSIPLPPYKASTLLMFNTAKGSPGIPIVWQKDDEFLGFRPMIAHNVLSMLAISTKDGIQCYSPQHALFLRLKIDQDRLYRV